MDIKTRLRSLMSFLEHRECFVVGVQIRTPDGREWLIAPRGDGFALFEVGPKGREEHDAVEGNNWRDSEMIDYLAAIAGRKGTAS